MASSLLSEVQGERMADLQLRNRELGRPNRALARATGLAQTGCPVGEAGFSLTELLTVLVIFGLFVVAVSPNVANLYQIYTIRANARQLATVLRLGRMKAVSNNLDYVAEIGASKATSTCQVKNLGPIMTLGRVDKYPAQDECYALDGKVTTTPLPEAARNQARFLSNGRLKDPKVAADKWRNPQWFMVKSVNGGRCMLVCVTSGGGILMNPLQTGSKCTTAPYGASNSTPCPAPI